MVNNNMGLVGHKQVISRISKGSQNILLYTCIEKHYRTRKKE